jgi:hypothetical protein
MDNFQGYLIRTLGLITTPDSMRDPKAFKRKILNPLKGNAVSKKIDDKKYQDSRLIAEPGLYQLLLNFERSVCDIGMKVLQRNQLK